MHDSRGNLAKIRDRQGPTTKYIYDLSNRLEKLISDNITIKYNYDINGNINKKNYLIKNENSCKPLYTINCEYNKDDNITKVEVDGNIINYNYDYLGRLVNKNINDNLHINYTYITKGERTSLIINTYTIGNDTYKYEYDDVYNITKIYLNNELMNEYEYDDINELIFEKNYLLNRKYNYVYDSEGNILVKKEYNLETNEVVSSCNYEYNNIEWEDQLTKFNNDSITYDEIGNPLTIGDAALTWKVGRRLATYTKGDLNVSYEYNVDGIRTSKIVNNQTTNYILEGDNIVIEESPKGMIYYLYDSNELIGLKYNDQTYFYKKNLQGDIIGLYNSDYEQIVTYTYDSWGKVLSIKDSNGNIITDSNHIGIMNPFRYRSYYYDEETKLYYLNSRYYNPRWGRFINADNLIGTTDKIITYNLYTYCENNPIIMKDYNGNVAGIDDAVVLPILGVLTLVGGGLYIYNKHKDEIAKGVENIANGISDILDDVGKKYNEARKKQNKKKYDDTPNNYVYTLNYGNEVIYVGRTNDIKATEYRHSTNPMRSHLKMKTVYGPMSKADARLGEEALIIKYGTLKSGKKGCNKIHGLNPNFPGYDAFMYGFRTFGDESLTYVGGC